MFEVIAYQKINAIISIDRKIKVRTEDYENSATGENLRKWYVDANTISSKLQTYYPETTLTKMGGILSYFTCIYQCFKGLFFGIYY